MSSSEPRSVHIPGHLGDLTYDELLLEPTEYENINFHIHQEDDEIIRKRTKSWGHNINEAEKWS